MKEQATEQSQTTLAIQQLYVKEQSCRVMRRALTQSDYQSLKAPIELQVNQTHLSGDDYEVTLSVHITAKIAEQTAYLLDAQQAGQFKLTGFDETQKRTVLNVYCASLLFPYLHHCVSQLTIAAGFPPLTLAPIDFARLYQAQQLRDKQAASVDSVAKTHLDGIIN